MTSIFSVDKNNILQIFSYLDIQKLSQCREVCKRWKPLAEDYSLWKNFFPKESVPANCTNFFSECVLFDIHAVEKKIAVFVNSLQKDQTSTFECYFPLTPYKISVKVAYIFSNTHPQENNQTEQLRTECLLLTKIATEGNSFTSGTENLTDFFTSPIVKLIHERTLPKESRFETLKGLPIKKQCLEKLESLGISVQNPETSIWSKLGEEYGEDLN